MKIEPASIAGFHLKKKKNKTNHIKRALVSFCQS